MQQLDTNSEARASSELDKILLGGKFILVEPKGNGQTVSFQGKERYSLSELQDLRNRLVFCKNDINFRYLLLKRMKRDKRQKNLSKDLREFNFWINTFKNFIILETLLSTNIERNFQLTKA